MTIINKTYGFIFVHVPKTGGTSVKEYFRAYGGADDLHIGGPADAERVRAFSELDLKKHSPVVQIRRAMGRAEFDRYFKFCVVRNPFIRTLSLFRFLKFNFRSWPRSSMMDEINTIEQ